MTNNSDYPVRILKISTCASVSGRSTLTYHVGCKDFSILLRIYRNTGSGYFSQEWIPLSTINQALDECRAITSFSLQSIFKGKSVNTAGFLIAVLKDIGLIQVTKDSARSYEQSESDTFILDTKKLIESGVNLIVESPSKSPQITKKGAVKPKPIKS